MNKDIILEAEFFLSSFFWGIALLFLYDCIRIFRRVKHHIWAAVAVEDCLFWGIAGIFIFHMVYEKNYGIIRAFAAGGMILGMWLYLAIISRWYVNTAVKLINMTEKGITRFVIFITKPLRFIYTKLDKIFSKLSSFLKGHINNFLNKRKKRLKISYKKYKIKKDAKKALKLMKKEAKRKKKHESVEDSRNKNKKDDHNDTVFEPRKYGVLEKIESR